jgi:hypothetical protein
LKIISSEERDAFFGTFEREAVHVEMRDIYSVKSERERFARFLEKGYRDHDAEAEYRQPWITLIQEAVVAGKTFRRVRVISEPVTDYIRYVWAGAGHSVEAGEQIKWLPRRLASSIALPGNDFWLFDDSTVVFTVFTGDGEVFERQLTADPAIVGLCQTAFEAVWSIAVPHGKYRPS